VGGRGLVAVGRRSWRPFAAPAAFLLAATLVVVAGRGFVDPAGTVRPVRQVAPKPASRPTTPRLYRVRAGDTLSAIAARTDTPLVRLRQLNPGLQPTALFIGQRIRLR
jgi:LysM repeat protein